MIRNELMGRQLKVVGATNDSLMGLFGEIIDETKETLRIRTDRGEKTLLKKHVTIEVDGIRFEGSKIAVRPEKRTKLTIKKWQRKKPQTMRP